MAHMHNLNRCPPPSIASPTLRIDERPRIAQLLLSLNLFPAAGIAVFGMFLTTVTGNEAAVLPWLWFAGGWLIYNVDRSIHELADVANTPQRHRDHSVYRRTRVGAIVCATLVLVVLSGWGGDRRFTLAIIGGALLCLGYSTRLPGFARRFKDIPQLKTVFPAAAITIAWLGLPALVSTPTCSPLLYIQLSAWTFLVVLINVWLCDLRDILGDRQHGVISLAVAFGQKRSLQVLKLLSTATVALAIALCMTSQQLVVTVPIVTVSLYMLALLHHHPSDHPRPEWFYHWLVDGFLYIPLATSLLLAW